MKVKERIFKERSDALGDGNQDFECRMLRGTGMTVEAVMGNMFDPEPRITVFATKARLAVFGDKVICAKPIPIPVVGKWNGFEVPLDTSAQAVIRKPRTQQQLSKSARAAFGTTFLIWLISMVMVGLSTGGDFLNEPELLTMFLAVCGASLVVMLALGGLIGYLPASLRLRMAAKRWSFVSLPTTEGRTFTVAISDENTADVVKILQDNGLQVQRHLDDFE
jgi:hypothetical protein